MTDYPTSRYPLHKRILFKIYFRSAQLNRYIRMRITPAGYLVVGLLILSAAFGIDTNRSVAYQFYPLGVAILIVSIVWNLVWRCPPLTAKRSCPRYASAGTPFSYRIKLTNSSKRTLLNCRIREWLRPPIPTRTSFLSEIEPGERKRNFVDRFFVYYRWIWLRHKAHIAETKNSQQINLPPHSETAIELTVTPLRRGVLNLNQLRLMHSDVLGMFWSTHRIPCDQCPSVIILPKRYFLPTLALPGESQYQAGGVSLSSSIGQSEEFMGLREYQPGDSLKHIHWKSWARQRKPIVKEYQDEFVPRYALVLDTFAQGIDETIFEEAVSIAASFAYNLDTKESLLDLLFVGNEAHCFTSGRGVTLVEKMLEILAAVTPCNEQPFSQLTHLVQSHSRDLSTCICVFVTWDDERKEFLEQLKVQNVAVRVIVLYNPPNPFEQVMQDHPDIDFIDIDSIQAKLALW